MPVYAYTAANCPSPQVPLSTLYAASSPANPVVGTTLGTGAAGAQALVAIINADQLRGNLLARYGGGFYAVWQGLDLSAGSGLTLNISAGQACADGPAEGTAAATFACTDGVVNRVWISRAGTINAVTSASATPLAPPTSDTQWVYLGAVACTGGSIATIDYSGRFELKGGLPWRETADEAEPEDTPSSELTFFNITAGGVYLWTGEEYIQLSLAEATLSASLLALRSEHDDLRHQFRLQLAWTRDTLGEGFVHPELLEEAALAG